MTAVMTAKALSGAVHHERHVAVGTFGGPTARPTGQMWGPPAAVDEHDRLLAALVQAPERGAGPRMQRPLAPVAPAHVEDLDRGHRPPVDAAAQLDALELQPALRPRCRRPEDERGTRRGGAAAGNLARVVAGVALLFVARVVLFVDDDQSQAGDRGEDGRTRADAHARLSVSQAMPLVAALPGRQPGVQHGDAIAESRLKAGHGLWRHPDLGHQDDHPAAPRERLLGGGEVDLGLPRAGDAVKQELGALRVEAGDDPVGRRALRGVELHRCRGRADRCDARPAADRLGAELNEASPFEPA